MINCIIIDDEPLALQQMELYVKKTPILNLMGCFDSAVKAFDFLRTNQIDLLFLDINMPEITGLEFAETLDASSKIIFVTAYREYALEGFQMDAADYLLKPLSYAAFLKSVEKVRTRYFSSQTNDPSNQVDFMFVRSNAQSVKIKLEHIKYIESKREYLDIYLTTGEIITTHCSLNTMDEKLPQHQFLRVHRSFIVNLVHVNLLERNCIIFGKQYIPINENAKDRVMKYIESGKL